MGKGQVNTDEQPTEASQLPETALAVKNLDFAYPGGPNVLNEVAFELAPGSRTLLVGGNGAGKSTLLRILGGKHMHDDDAVFVLGKNAFRDTTLNLERQYMDTNWGLRTVAFAGTGVAYQADIPVSKMMERLQGEFPERRDILYKLLGVDPDWRMHKVSDGQRRRVQMFLGLLRPFKMLLLDEVTAVLDLVCRQDLLDYLKMECETRGCTIVYATHIFDGLDEWATHCVYLKAQPENGRIGYFGALQDIPKFQELLAAGAPSPLMGTVEFWLRAELAIQRNKAEIYEKEAGANAVGTESELTKSHYGAGGFAPGRLMATTSKEGGGFDSGRYYNYW